MVVEVCRFPGSFFLRVYLGDMTKTVLYMEWFMECHSGLSSNIGELLDGKNDETSSIFSGTCTSCLDKCMLSAGMLELRILLQGAVG